MRNLVYIFVSLFCVVLLNSCAVCEKSHARMENKKIAEDIRFSLDSIKKIASARSERDWHSYEVCNWQKRNFWRTPSFVSFFGKGGGSTFIHYSDGSIKELCEEDSVSSVKEQEQNVCLVDNECEDEKSMRFYRETNYVYTLIWGLYEHPWREEFITDEIDKVHYSR